MQWGQAWFPLFRLLRRLQLRRERGTAGLLVAFALVALTAAAVPLWPGLVRQSMAVQHLQPRSLAAWFGLGPLPKMYGFGNRVFLSDEPLTEYLVDRRGGAPAGTRSFWWNHYPGRAVRLERQRAQLAARAGELHVLIRSRYRGSSLSTPYVVRVRDGRLQVRRRPP